MWSALEQAKGSLLSGDAGLAVDAGDGRQVDHPALRAGDFELHQFRCEASTKAVAQAGFVESVREYWEATIKENALAMATAAAPLRRQTAERLIAGLIERARLLNADDMWATVSASSLCSAVISAELNARTMSTSAASYDRVGRTKKMRQVDQERRKKRGGFRNISDWVMWPRLEVLRYLRACARGLSIHELEDWTRGTYWIRRRAQMAFQPAVPQIGSLRSGENAPGLLPLRARA